MDRGIKQRLKKTKVKAKKLGTSRPREAKKQFSRDFEGYKMYRLREKSGLEGIRQGKLMGKEKKHRRNLKSLNSFTIQSQGLGLRGIVSGSPELIGGRRGVKSRGLGIKLRSQKTRSKTYTESQLVKFRKQSQIEAETIEGRSTNQSGEKRSKAINLQVQMPDLEEEGFNNVQHHVSPAMSRPTSPDHTDYSNFVSVSSRNMKHQTGKTHESEISYKQNKKKSKPRPARKRKKPGHFRNQSHQIGSIGNNFSGLHSIRNIQRNKKSPIIGHMSKSNFIHPNSMISPMTKFQKKSTGYGGAKGVFPAGSAFVKKKNPFSRHRKNMSSNFSGLVKGRKGLPLSFADDDDNNFESEFRKKKDNAVFGPGLRSEDLGNNSESIGFSQSFNTNQSNQHKQREQKQINQTPKKKSKKSKKSLLDLGRSQNSRLISKLTNPNLNIRSGLGKANKLFSMSNNKQKPRVEGPLRGKNQAIRDIKRKMNKTVGQGGGLHLIRLKQYNTNSSIQDSERHQRAIDLDQKSVVHYDKIGAFRKIPVIPNSEGLESQLKAKQKGERNIIDSKHMIEMTKRNRKQKKRHNEKKKRKEISELINHDFVKNQKAQLKKSGYHSQRADWHSLKDKNKDDFQSYREGYGQKSNQNAFRRMDPSELVDYIGNKKSKQEQQAEIDLGEFVMSRGIKQNENPKFRNLKSRKKKKWGKSTLRSERGLGRLGSAVGKRDVQSQMGSEYNETANNEMGLDTGTGFDTESTNIYQGKSHYTNRSRKSAFGGTRVGKVLLRDSEGREYWVPLSVLEGQHPDSESKKKAESQRQISTNPERPWRKRKNTQKSEKEALLNSVASLKEQIMKESRENSIKMNKNLPQKNFLMPMNQPPKNSPSNFENIQRIGKNSGQKRFEIFSEPVSKVNSDKKSGLLMGIYGVGTKGKRKLRIRQNQLKQKRQEQKEDDHPKKIEKKNTFEEKLMNFRDERVTIKDRENIKNMESLRSWELDSFAKEGWGPNESQGLQHQISKAKVDIESANNTQNNLSSRFFENNFESKRNSKLGDLNDSVGNKKEFMLEFPTKEIKNRNMPISRRNSSHSIKSPHNEKKEELMEGLLSEGEESRAKAKNSEEKETSSARSIKKYIRVSGKKTSGKKFEIFGNESDCQIEHSITSENSNEPISVVKSKKKEKEKVITYSNLNQNQNKKAKQFCLIGDEEESEEDLEGPRPPNVSSRYDSEKLDQGNLRMQKNFEIQMEMNLGGENQFHNFEFPEMMRDQNETDQDLKVKKQFVLEKNKDFQKDDKETNESDLSVKEIEDNLLYKERRRDPRESEGNLYNGKVGNRTKKGFNQSNISNRKTSNKVGDRLFESRISKQKHQRIQIGRDRMKSNRVLQDLKRFSKEVEIPVMTDWLKKPSNNIAKRKRNRHKKNAHSEHIPDIFTEFVQKIGAPIDLHLKVNNMTPALSRKGSSDEEEFNIHKPNLSNKKLIMKLPANDFANLKNQKAKEKHFIIKDSQVENENSPREKNWLGLNEKGILKSEEIDSENEQNYKVYEQEDFSGLFGGGSEGFSPRREVSDIEESGLQNEDLVFKKQKMIKKNENRKILMASDLDAVIDNNENQPALEKADEKKIPSQFTNKMNDSKKVFLEDNDPNKYGSNKHSNERSSESQNRVKVKKRKRRINFIELEEMQRESNQNSVSSRSNLNSNNEYLPSLPNQNRERLKLIERRRLREIQAFKRKRANIERERIEQNQDKEISEGNIVVRAKKKAHQQPINRIQSFNGSLSQKRNNIIIQEKSQKSSTSPMEDLSSKGQSNMAPNSIVNSFGNHTPAQRSSRSNRISITIISHKSSRNSEINNIRINHSLRNSQKAVVLPESLRQSKNVFHIDSPEGVNGESTQNQQIQIDLRASETAMQDVGVGLEMGNTADANNFTLGNQQLSREIATKENEAENQDETHCINLNIPAINSSFEESASFGNSEESDRTPITENTFGQGIGQVLQENRPSPNSFRHSFGLPNPEINNNNQNLGNNVINETRDNLDSVNVNIQNVDNQFDPDINTEAEQTLEKTRKEENLKNDEKYSPINQNIKKEENNVPKNKKIKKITGIPKNKPKHKKSNEFFYERDSSIRGSNSENSSRGKSKALDSKATKRATREMIIRAHVRDGIRGNFNSPVRKKRVMTNKIIPKPANLLKNNSKQNQVRIPVKEPKEMNSYRSKKRDVKPKNKEKTNTRTRMKKKGAHLKNSLMIGMGRQKIKADLKLYENKSSLTRVNKSNVRSRNSSPGKKKNNSISKAGNRNRKEKRAGDKNSDRLNTKNKAKDRRVENNTVRRKKSRHKLNTSESKSKKAGRKNSNTNSRRREGRLERTNRAGNLNSNRTRNRTRTNQSRGNTQTGIGHELFKDQKGTRNKNNKRTKHRRDHSEVIVNPRRPKKPQIYLKKMNKNELEQKRILETRILRYVKEDCEMLQTSLDFYRLKKMLGQGSYAKVYLGESVLCGRKVAIKKYEKSGLKKKSSIERVSTEIRILKKMNHQNIIKFLEIFENQMYVFIVLEYGDGGDLLNHLKNSGRFPEEEFRKILQQIVDALSYIHGQGILHRDIKLDNIIYTTDKTVKICDFGISRKMDEHKYVYEHIGTPAYLAPEIILECGYRGFGADIWSLGVTSFMAMTGNVPFKGTTIEELHSAILKKNFKFPARPELSSKMKRTIRGMLEKDPEKRFTLKQICNTLGLTLPMPVKQGLKENLADPDILSIIKSFGFPEKFITKAMEKFNVNHVTALYKLLQK